MGYNLTEDEWFDSMEEYAKKVFSEVSNADYYGWRSANGTTDPEAFFIQIRGQYGDEEDGSSENSNSKNEGSSENSNSNDEWSIVAETIEETGASPEQAAAGIRWAVNQSGKGGRPSKVEKWESRIRDGSATLEDAKPELAKSTWYKLKERVGE